MQETMSVLCTPLIYGMPLIGGIVVWISKIITERSMKKILDDYQFPDMMEKLRIQTRATEEIKTV